VQRELQKGSIPQDIRKRLSKISLNGGFSFTEEQILDFMKIFVDKYSSASFNHNIVEWRRFFHELAYGLNFTTRTTGEGFDGLAKFPEIFHKIDNSFLYAFYTFKLCKMKVLP
jgi:hypothetical protein